MLRQRNTELILTYAQLAREGITFRAHIVNQAHDQIRDEISRLGSTGTISDDVPVVAGPDTQLAIDWVFPHRMGPRAIEMAHSYLAGRGDRAPAEARDQLNELWRVITRAAAVSSGTGYARDVAKLEAVITIAGWTDQLGAVGQPSPVRLDPADPHEVDPLAALDLSAPRRQHRPRMGGGPGFAGIPDGAVAQFHAGDEPIPRPLVHSSTEADSTTNPNNVRQEQNSTERRHIVDHHTMLPEDIVRFVPEPAETADLGEISKLHAARMPDGRTVYFRTLGDPSGYPIMVSPGTPVGVDGPLPDAQALADRGYFVVVVERPGYGDSDPCPGARWPTAPATSFTSQQRRSASSTTRYSDAPAAARWRSPSVRSTPTTWTEASRSSARHRSSAIVVPG